MSLVEKLFGSFSDRELKKVNPITKQVLALEPKYQAMSDADLQAQTAVFKQQLAEGKTLDDILPDAFAVCREAAWRVLGMKHFPVQVTGGIALHRGDIAEMQTGEGKTLVATLPAYLNALTGEGVHIVTVNDYLAKRDSEWMGKLYRWLGLTVGLIVQGMDGDARRAAYNADITYGTNNEFGFDYLRDNMVTYKANMVQRGHAFAIVDEVDSILIDEARTPLIISGKGEGIVLAVGKDTLYGSFTKPDAEEKTSFQQGANSIAWVMLRFIAVLIPFVFILLGITGGKWLQSFAFALSVAVGLMPEMLPMVITACLARGSLSMSRKQTIIKDINAMQGFGSMEFQAGKQTHASQGERGMKMITRKLNREQLTELKRNYYSQLANECLFADAMGTDSDGPSYDMLERINEYVPDEMILEEYDDTFAEKLIAIP